MYCTMCEDYDIYIYQQFINKKEVDLFDILMG